MKAIVRMWTQENLKRIDVFVYTKTDYTWERKSQEFQEVLYLVVDRSTVNP